MLHTSVLSRSETKNVFQGRIVKCESKVRILSISKMKVIVDLDKSCFGRMVRINPIEEKML